MTKKITVSLPDHLVEQANLAVRAGRFASVSAYVAAGMQVLYDTPTLKEFLQELDEEFGPIPPELQAQVDAEMEEADRKAAAYYAERQARGEERPA